jgi:hypothetical protein
MKKLKIFIKNLDCGRKSAKREEERGRGREKREERKIKKKSLAQKGR